MANDGFTDFDSMFVDVTNETPSDVPFTMNDSAKTAEVQATVKPEVVSAPVQTQSVAVSKTSSAPAVSSGVGDDFEIGFSDEMKSALEDAGVMVADIGVKVSRVPIEKYKASSSKVDRISFLTKKVLPVKFHYFEGAGSVMCFRGKCCEMGGTPQVRYLFPIAVYQTDSDGNISGKKVEMKILSAGEDLYKSITTINKGTAQYGGIDHVDLLVTCTDDQYQKISLTFAGAAVWRKYKPIADFLAERWQKDGANAYMAVARKVDLPAFNKLLGLEDDIPQSSFDATAAQDLSKFFDD